MKKLSILFFVMLCACVVFGEEKRVAVATPTASVGVDPIDISIVRGNLVQYISKMEGYKAFTRTDIDQITKEMVFEQSGMVDDIDKKKLGVLKGVDIILVSSLTYGRGRLNVEAKFVYVETGEMGNAISQVMNPEVPEDMEKSCKTLAENLTGVSVSSSNNTPSGGNTNKTPSQNTPTPTPTPTPTKLTVGMSYQGGIIAYIDATGQHGLIAAPQDQSADIKWYNGSLIVTGATGTAIGTGKSNTAKIIQAQGVGSYAAKLCDDLVLNGYDDWYLPSKDELNELYKNKNLIGGFTDRYWSSSEHYYSDAWNQYFGSGYQDYYLKLNTCRVRAVRAF